MCVCECVCVWRVCRGVVKGVVWWCESVCVESVWRVFGERESVSWCEKCVL